MSALSCNRDSITLRRLFSALLVDLTALLTTVTASIVDYTAGRAQIVKLVADNLALATAVDALAAKLNSDAGVTDTDYSTANAAAVTAADPAAVTASAPSLTVET